METEGFLLIALRELLSGEHGELLDFLQCKLVPNESMRHLSSCVVGLQRLEVTEKKGESEIFFLVSFEAEYHNQIFGCELSIYLGTKSRVVIDIHKNGHNYLGSNRVRYYLAESYHENQFSWKVPTGYCTMNITLKLPV